MDKDGRVFKKHYSKFRQINRYLEIVDDVFQKACPRETSLKVIDFGCGKAYLTFALYHYLHDVKGLKPEIIGLDLKENVIEFCNGVARDLGYSGLEFKLGDIADYRDTGCDMVVTLRLRYGYGLRSHKCCGLECTGDFKRTLLSARAL